MDKNRTYVGLATSCRKSSIAIVSSAGEIQFAHEGERILERNGGPAYSETLAKLVDEYCSSESEVVLALATNEKSLDARPELRQICRADSNRVEEVHMYRGVPTALRAAEVASSFSKQCKSQLLSQIEATFEYELERVRGWKDGILETRRYQTDLAHAAAACFAGPYEEALCAVVDGSEGQSSRFYLYRDGALFEIGPARRPKHEGSLGALIRDVCNACGFQAALGEHWKVMDLATHGTFDSDVYAFLKAYVSADRLSLKTVDRTEMVAIYDKLDAVSRRSNEPVLNAANLACTTQTIFLETLCALLTEAHATGASRNLVFTGDCALTPSVNGAILERTDFKSLYIPSAPDAGGNAVGAALLAYQEDGNVVNPRPRFQTPYLGFEFQSVEFEAAAKELKSCKTTSCAEDSTQQAAQLLAAGMTVGWINGRAEFACRALGNRSVLIDPRCASLFEFINRHSIKSTRSFGVAILHEYGSEYFDGYQTSPYGERALKFRLKAARRIPSTVQIDGRVQVQSVRRDWNQRLYDLIFNFYIITGIPLLINMNYGIADGSLPETPEDVYVTFSTCKIDALFVDDLLIVKQ